jgi:hypothetical protein
MILTAVAVNAQDANNPWHMTASENDVEVAFYNTEKITGIEVTTPNVIITLDNGKQFSHPTATTTFGFDPRANGTRTGNENIEATAWRVFYANGSLNFSEPVNDIAVYTLTGTLTAKFTGNYTDVPVYLNQGLYIVRAGNKSAKLLVGNTGYGGTTVASKELVQTIPATATVINDPPLSLCAGETIKIYWNIKAGKNNMTVEISDVVSFRFTADNSIIFTLKNGNTIELTDYQGIEFSIEPAPPTTTSNWDLEKTFKFGGASYGDNSLLPYNQIDKVIYLSVVHKQGVILYDVQNNKEIKIPHSGINPKVWTEYDKEYPRMDNNARLSFCTTEYFAEISISYRTIIVNSLMIEFIALSTNKLVGSLKGYYTFNNNTNLIPSSIKQNAAGGLIVEAVDAFGIKISHTFTGW